MNLGTGLTCRTTTRPCGPSRGSRRGSRLDGLPGGRGLNIAYEAVDRHAAGPRGGTVALRCVAKDGSVSELTYADLAGQTNRFANLLRSLGVGQGDRVFTLLGRVPELYLTVLGTLRTLACSARCSRLSVLSRSGSGCGWVTRKCW